MDLYVLVVLIMYNHIFVLLRFLIRLYRIYGNRLGSRVKFGKVILQHQNAILNQIQQLYHLLLKLVNKLNQKLLLYLMIHLHIFEVYQAGIYIIRVSNHWKHYKQNHSQYINMKHLLIIFPTLRFHLYLKPFQNHLLELTHQHHNDLRKAIYN